MFPCTVWAVPEYVTVLPAALAVMFEMPDVPPISSVAFDACVTVPPTPESAVVTDRLLLFVKLIPVTVALGNTNDPVNACGLVSKVYVPDVPAENVPLLVIPLWNVTLEFTVFVNCPPEAIVNVLLKVFAPVADPIVKFPPEPTLVVPLIVKVNPFAVNVEFPIERFPPIKRLATVAVDTAPVIVRLPVTFAVPVCNVFTPTATQKQVDIIIVVKSLCCTIIRHCVS